MVDCLKGTCRHAMLCQAQGEDFCLAQYNKDRHQEYLQRKSDTKKQAAEVASDD